MRRDLTPSRSRIASAAIALRSAVFRRSLTALVIGLGVACGSALRSDTDPCETAYAGQCGFACQTDGDCTTGVHCGLAGICTAECGAGTRQCAEGLVCSDKGRCTGNGAAPGTDPGSTDAGGGFTFEAGTVSDGSSIPLDEGGACAAETRRGEGIPLDMFVMYDRSGSMNDDVTGGKKWPLVNQAMQAFVSDPQSAGIGIGIQFFSLPATGTVPDDNNFSCSLGDYAKAAVPIAQLPGNGAAIMSAINAVSPSGKTPTRLALLGAIQYAQQYAPTQPTHKVIVVLATDGEPNVCDSQTVQVVADVAAQGVAGTPSMPTYVIGVGSSTANLNAIAQAGGTQQALIIDTTKDTTQQFIDAMNAIRGAALIPCEYQIPKPDDAGTVDFDKVNVNYTAGAGTIAHLARASDMSLCDPTTGGWYYDNPATPANIQLCPASCDAIKGDSLGKVDVLLGCTSVRITPR